ncbi:extracellular solute-binding protein [Paenibacillus sp. LMG 31461]|uniref:Extracellular solute-binding protein n=1 Tax=Paenibacillus plantarum TaxID=2654975 RepID=A0ABX1XK28_9BACL|nr:extracellular solute-binding protein [Paenibacillus plantarum]NOU68872.1 extracellular solute-binding protein [Paenibacillus plantarum]
MRGKRFKVLSLLTLSLLMATMAACSKDTVETVATNVPSGAPSSAPSGQPATTEGPNGQYSPPITMSTVRSTNPSAVYPAGDSVDNNIWYREYASTLGIKLVNKWITSDTQYANKITVSMVANDLPDFFQVDAQQLQILASAGQIADLSSAYEKYASPLSKRVYEQSDGITKKAGTFNGKFLGLAMNGGVQSDMQMIYIRKDWLDKLKLSPPKTMDDVIQIALAFANNDPDGNGKKDTFGLSLDYNLWNGWSGLDGFFNGYHAYPYNPTKGAGTQLMFLKGSDGKPVLADTMPEVKTALGKLQELYKAGAINPEFSTIDGNKSATLATSGKVGMTFGATFVPSWPVNNMKKDDPKVDWQAYPLVSADSSPIMVQSMSAMPSQFIVVNKNSQHPEAVFKMLNLYMEKLYGSNPDEKYHAQVENGKTINIQNFSPIRGGYADTNLNDGAAVREALKSSDASKLSTAAKTYYDKIKLFQNGDMTQWWQNATWGPGGAYEILGSYIKDKKVVTSQYYGQPTPTMIAKGPALRDLEATTFTKIIMGSLPVDAFDTEFVAKWKSQGGNDILTEVATSGSFN